MRLNLEKMKKLMEERGWSEVMLARKLDLDYSYVYRVMRSERGVGKKFLTGLLKLCERDGMEFKDFIFLDDNDDKSVKTIKRLHSDQSY